MLCGKFKFLEEQDPSCYSSQWRPNYLCVCVLITSKNLKVNLLISLKKNTNWIFFLVIYQIVCYSGDNWYLYNVKSSHLRAWTISVFIHLLYSFSSVQSFSHVQLFVTLWTAAHQASSSITNSWSLLKLMSIVLVTPSNHLILCLPLILPSIFPIIRVFSNESVLHIRWPKYWISASASVLPMNI